MEPEVSNAVSDRATIILAAGKSTRMNSDLPKVLHEVCGQPMLAYTLDAARDAGVDRLIVVVGHGKDEVISRFGDTDDVQWVEQVEQYGTGHAVQCARDALAGFSGSVLVIAGDMPLVRRETLARLLQTRESRGDSLTLATAVLADPTGYGRIVRDGAGKLSAIVEERECTKEQREIREVNPSYYCFDSKRLFESLDKIKPDNAKGEYYLTDAIAFLRKSGDGVSAIHAIGADEAVGINSRFDLAEVGRAMQDRIQVALMANGVTIIDPDNTWIEFGATIGKDTVVYPFTFIATGATIGTRCRVGPFAHVGAGEVIDDGSEVARGSMVHGVCGS